MSITFKSIKQTGLIKAWVNSQNLINPNYIFLLAPHRNSILDLTNNYTTSGGVLSNAVQDPWGGNDNVLYFDNSNWITTNFSFGQLNSIDYTIEIWVRFISRDDDGIIGHLNGQPHFGFSIRQNLGFVRYDFPYNSRIQASLPSINTWVHLAGTKSGNSFSFYLNGLLVGTKTSTTTIPSNNMTIGGYYSSSYLLHGYIGTVAISNKSLTPSEFCINLKP